VHYQNKNGWPRTSVNLALKAVTADKSVKVCMQNFKNVKVYGGQNVVSKYVSEISNFGVIIIISFSGIPQL